MTREIVHRGGFAPDLLAFDAPSIKQILDKCEMLRRSPEPEGKAKAKLDGRTDDLHRLRSGKFRIFYTYDDEKVSLWTVRRKTVRGEYRGRKGGDVTYDNLPDIEDDDLDLDIPELTAAPSFDQWIQPKETKTPLPEPISTELLDALKVPAGLHARLLPIENQEDLLACPAVPEEHLLAIDRHMFEEPIDLRAEQPELVAPGGVDDLLRYAEGELVGFLLRLNPEQEKFVTWATTANGPTLVKGGPGTGKSTVALYRTREMIRVLREAGVAEPRILFTTYTNALVTFSQQLLESLLGDDARCVEVLTVDKYVTRVLTACGENIHRPDASRRETLRTAALERVEYAGSVVQQQSHARIVERLGRRYVFEEIETVIQARDIRTLEEYLDTARPGRRVPLDQGKRRAVWAVAEAYAAALDEAGLGTWQQSRARAARLAAAGEPNVETFDAVVVDEAQDLDASALRLLVEVCAEPNRLFVTADVSQSIWGNGFSWSSVHDQLRFVGRTGELRANHRSTEQITEAARDHLGSLDAGLVPDRQRYVHKNGALPAVRAVSGVSEEARLIARFIKGATQSLRLPIGSGAVIVPGRDAGETLARELDDRGVDARYRSSREFDSSDGFRLDDGNQVTILSLTGAKGLEFPVVAVAGFGRSKWPHAADLDGDAWEEAMVTARRQLFVAMTRAMRALLVVTPAGHDSMLFDGFDPTLWNTGDDE